MPDRLSEGNEPAPWANHRVAFTGRLSSLTRREALALLTRCGGQFSPTVGQATTVLVVGTSRWPLDRRGRLTRKLLRARLMQQQGGTIEVMDEEAFLVRSQLRPFHEEEQLYLLNDVERILRVSRDRLRTLLRTQLIEPAASRNEIPLFRFRDIQRAGSLIKLLDQGVPLQRLRRSFQRLQSIFPWAHASSEGLQWVENWGKQIVLRTHDGQLLEPTGQRLLDFDAPLEPPTLRLPRDIYAEAVRCEAEGDWPGATDAYHQVLRQEGPDADLYFHLGNCLYAQDQLEEAAIRFREAIELDRRHVEAWNNLGNVLAQQGRHWEAIEAYSTAVRLDPDWTDARFGLADVLEEAGRSAEAARHWRALCFSSDGEEYAHYARQRLGG